jgi:hypothetical protein
MINENLSANIYINLLDENLLEFDRAKDMTFMQNLAACYRAVFKAS